MADFFQALTWMQKGKKVKCNKFPNVFYYIEDGRMWLKEAGSQPELVTYWANFIKSDGEEWSLHKDNDWNIHKERYKNVSGWIDSDTLVFNCKNIAKLKNILIEDFKAIYDETGLEDFDDETFEDMLSKRLD